MPRWWGVILLIALLIGLASMADVAAQQSVISACVNNSSGELKLVSPGTACAKNWALVQWNTIGPPGPVDVTVDCGAGQTITQALQGISGSPLTVTVRGTCNENVTITRNDVTLRGESPTATITGSNPASDTIRIDGAQRVLLDTLIVNGGRDGVGGTRGASFTVLGSTIQHAGNYGIMVGENSQAAIDDNLVENSAIDGIRVIGNSSANITNSTVRWSGQFGINIQEGSSARIGFTYAQGRGGNTIEGNSRDGIQVYMTSSAVLYGNTIQGNCTLNDGNCQGTSAHFSSLLFLNSGNTISNNNGPGIYLKYSSLRASGGWGLPYIGPNAITSNTGGGIFAHENSEVDLRDGITITDNNNLSGAWSGFGISLDYGTRLRMRNTAVSSNAQGGIAVRRGSSARFDSGSSVTNNQGFGLDCWGNGGPSYVGTFVGGGNTSGDRTSVCLPF